VRERTLQTGIVLPTGTKVVGRIDRRIGVIVHTPASSEHAYRVRFPDGSESSLHRRELTVFRQDQAFIPGDAYLPPADLEWSLVGVPEQLENDQEEVYWELEKFLRLALKANPNVLECLYAPMVEYSRPIADELIAMRHIFLSQHTHRTYNAYVLSQFKKLEQDLRNRGEVRWKHVMHLIRLLLSGVSVLRDGLVPLRVDQYRDRLLAIRAGQVSWDEVEAWRLALHRELDSALASTRLPEHPDYQRANEFLIRARRLASSPDYSL